MYYNVVVKEFYEYTGMVFHFGVNFEKALKFATDILKNSEYCVEIIQIPEETEE